ncbi:type II secretion system protein N [Wenzhouxiangella sp. EGI_FJ10305]|uniref:type II secretion system protein N n=1 Tax=Wenzhouxiangella sp. EGI_FJ10305 TaxID=3243768 RepID=UPI0035DE3278
MMSPAWSSRLAMLSSAVLVLAVVWLVVRSMWLVLGGVSVDSAPALPVPEISEVGGASGEFRWNLFGRSASPAVRLQPVPVSDSRLRLKGVVAGDRGYAIISSSGSGEDVFRVGDELPGGGEVETIESRQVIILRDGRRETLAMDPDAASGARRASHTSGSEQVADEPSQQLPGIRGFSAPEGASVASLPEAARSAGLDAGELAQSISVMPVSGGGFRVRPGRNARLFQALGLEVNDVVLSVNGQPLESAQAVQGLFSDVMSSGEVSIKVRRGEREMTLRPDIEQIMGSLQSQ